MKKEQSIQLFPYNPHWPKQYEVEKKAIVAAIGSWIDAIEHIGSTAIEGIKAKPIIDVLIGVQSLSIVNQHCIQPLATIGYEYVPQHEAKMPDRRFFRKTINKRRFAHLHIVIHHSFDWKRQIAFRDFLHSHREFALEYEDLKLQLAKQTSTREEYVLGKEDWIKKIEKKWGE